MCTISAVAANGYTLRTLKGNVIYYPNIYVILLGESGLGKGFPVNLAKRLVQEADCTRVIAGRSSIQAIVKELATTKSVQGKPLITDSRGFIVNGELSTAVIQDPDSLTILTDLFDRNYNTNWVNMLKGDGMEKLKEPYITCLFGSSPAHFYEAIPQVNIEGGYIARNFIVYEEKRSKDLDLLDSEEESVDADKFINIIVPKYVPHLQKIAKNKARIIPSEDARQIFNTWRRKWRREQADYNDKTKFTNRVPDHVLKVAMLLCLARYDSDFVVTRENIEHAISQVSALAYAVHKTTTGTGLNPISTQTKRVVDYLIAAPDNEYTRTELLVKGYGDYEETILDKIIDTLMTMGWAKRSRVGVGRNSDYLIKLAGEPLFKYQQFKAQNNGRLK